MNNKHIQSSARTELIDLKRSVPTGLKIFVVLLVAAFSAASFAQHYTKTDLTANLPGTSATAENQDANLVNAWGLARSFSSFWWVSDNGTGLSTLYDQSGVKQTLVVTIPPPNGQTGASAPTGMLFNPTSVFKIQLGGNSDKASFLFVTENGTIAGWSPNVNPTQAVIAVDNSTLKAIYKGCALVETNTGPRLFVANFYSGKVEVYDGSFTRIKRLERFFSIGVNGYAPFNIQNVGGNLVVTYARKYGKATDETAGPGLGRVAVFDPNGKKLLTLQKGLWMNAPWGIALAPSDFGEFSHRLLIGNFGDGKINAFNAVTGKFEGALLAADSSPIKIDGLWAISFGGGNAKSGALNELYFTAGPNGEANGLFGKLAAVSTEQKGSTE